MSTYSVVDLFCGIGGLTHGFVMEGFDVRAGIDCDPSCEYGYEANNPKSTFVNKQLEDVSASEIEEFYPSNSPKILVGCAPCQPFSSYTNSQSQDKKDWGLLSRFLEIIEGIRPDIVSMENVVRLRTFRGGEVLEHFSSNLEKLGYYVSINEVFCPDYGIPQSRKRLVLLASLHGEIDLINSTHSPDNYITVRDVIGHLPDIEAGVIHPDDRLHFASSLSPLNKQRIQVSVPGGTWRDWSEDLIAGCHKKKSGKSYPGVYGRMEWDKPAPTITTQFYGFGNGRFGHPEQDRALSIREGALIQTFPDNYEFAPPEEEIHLKTIGRQIGNAVPVQLGRIIARSIRKHLESLNA